MANYNQVSYGSTDKKTVKTLQELLNKNGASLTEDGIFGNQTQQAVEKYQQDNNLTVDGIAGNQTWGALTKAQSQANNTNNTPAQIEENAPAFTYEPYKPSDTVTQAEALLQQQLNNKPGAYQSTWNDQMNETLQQILNREKFSYDLNGDALYQQMKDQYVTLGQQASMDAMGKAAALTGGHGNSYAQQVGQQAYQGYLQQLNDQVPELYQLALSQHNAEGDALRNNAALMAQMEDQEYGRYRDQLADYYAELDRLTEDARYQGDREYNRYMDAFNIAYGQHRDQVADQQWQAQFDEAKRQYDEQMGLSKAKSTGSGRYVSTTPIDDPGVVDDGDLDGDGYGSTMHEPGAKTYYQELEDIVDRLVIAGKTQGAIKAKIWEYEKEGKITPEKAQKLMSKYVPKAKVGGGPK